MTARLMQVQRALVTARGRRLLAGRAFVVGLVLTLLLIPSTCAQMAGPHSIFTDPASGGHDHHHHADSTSAVGYASVEDLVWHVVNGDGSPGWMLNEATPQDDECPTAPRLHDLPSTMSMSAVNAPMTLECGVTLELPAADEPAVAISPALHATSVNVESPPPR
jgi:hypothetical protein